MARPRSELSKMLHDICGEHVYFQPPTGTMLKYPCLVYSLDQLDVQHADNEDYLTYDRYSMTYITRDPDDENLRRLAKLPWCSMGSGNTVDNLYHRNYTIYI